MGKVGREEHSGTADPALARAGLGSANPKLWTRRQRDEGVGFPQEGSRQEPGMGLEWAWNVPGMSPHPRDHPDFSLSRFPMEF